MAAALALLGLACSKDLPSSPAGSAGEPVLINGKPEITMSGTIRYKEGVVKNRSGWPIYNFRVALVVYRGDPYFAEFTDTSEVLLTSLASGVEKPFAPVEVMGQAFVNAFPVYEILPP